MTVLRTILSLTLTAFLLCGCGNSEAAAPVEEVPEVTEEQVTEEPKEEVQQPAEEETAEEEVAEEPKEEETSTGMPEAQVTTTVADIYSFLSYAESLDKPALLIYNQNEGYVINMGEGEYYQLKKDDRIFEYTSERSTAYSDTLEAEDRSNIAKDENKSYVNELRPDYSKYDSPHEVMYVVYYTEEYEKGDYFLLTCYLDAPAE